MKKLILILAAITFFAGTQAYSKSKTNESPAVTPEEVSNESALDSVADKDAEQADTAPAKEEADAAKNDEPNEKIAESVEKTTTVSESAAAEASSEKPDDARPSTENAEDAATEKKLTDEKSTDESDSEPPAMSEPLPFERSEKALKTELNGNLGIHVPIEGDWDPGFGFQAVLRHWFSPKWAISGALGYELWSLKGETLNLVSPSLSTFDASGDATVIPLSIGAARRFEDISGMRFLLDGGLRYLLLDSEVAVLTSYEDYRGNYYDLEGFVDNEEVLMLYLDAELRKSMGDDLFWTAAAGFQFAISDPDPNWLLEDVGNNFDALQFRLGLGSSW